jgi:hypothetical protein
MVSASMDSSDAQVLEDARTTSTPPASSAIGIAWSEIRGPTAARQSARSTGDLFGAKRSSPERARIASMVSGE